MMRLRTIALVFAMSVAAVPVLAAESVKPILDSAEKTQA